MLAADEHVDVAGPPDRCRQPLRRGNLGGAALLLVLVEACRSSTPTIRNGVGAFVGRTPLQPGDYCDSSLIRSRI
jgi:hypothetical protein